MFDFLCYLLIAALLVYILPTIIRVVLIVFAIFGALVMLVCFLIAKALSFIIDRKEK